LLKFPRDKNEKVGFLKKRKSTDATLRQLLAKFSFDLQRLLTSRAPVVLGQIWAMERKRPAGRAPRARNTFLRRGLSKLLIFEDIEVALRLYTGKKVKLGEVPAYAFALGLAKKAIGRATPGDEEIQSAVTLLGERSVRRVVGAAPL